MNLVPLEHDLTQNASYQSERSCCTSEATSLEGTLLILNRQYFGKQISLGGPSNKKNIIIN